MPAYCYQCSECYDTISADPLPAGEKYVHVVQGVCGSCQSSADHDREEEDDDD